MKEKEKICTIDYVLGFNDLFYVYSPINNERKEQYIIYPNEAFNLNILELTTKKIIKELIGHKNHITQVKYFSNKGSINYYIKDIKIDEIIKQNEQNEEKNKIENEEKKENKERGNEKKENKLIKENKKKEFVEILKENEINKIQEEKK